MERLSSTRMFYHKRVLPALWFAGALAFLFFGLFSSPAKPSLLMLMVTFCVICFGIVGIRRNLREVCDEVWDCGDHLRVRRGDVEDRIPFRNLVSVRTSGWVDRRLVMLMLRDPESWGDEVAFIPRSADARWRPSAHDAILQHLYKRIKDAS